jgi:uncharacterized protein (TIGR03067 family)
MATLAAPASVLAESEVWIDLEQLQGTWTSVAGRRGAEFLVAGMLFTVRFTDGEVYMGAFNLNPRARPKTMDMRIDEGPGKHRGKIAHCIFELVGDTLHWCPAEPGTEERLASFPSVLDPHYLSMVFRREPPQRRARSDAPVGQAIPSEPTS